MRERKRVPVDGSGIAKAHTAENGDRHGESAVSEAAVLALRLLNRLPEAERNFHDGSP